MVVIKIIQNEIINLLARFVVTKIVDQIKSIVGGAAYIGVICDKTSDISRHEQVSLILSYMDDLHRKPNLFSSLSRLRKQMVRRCFH